MEKIDLLKFRKKHKKKKIAGIFLTIIFLIAGSSFLSFKIFYLPKKLNIETTFFESLSHLVAAHDRDIVANRDMLNILILGMGGAGHEGPYLTDTILIASIDKNKKRVALTSLPRDLLVDTKKFGKIKINHINAYAELERGGNGAKFTKNILEELLGINIDYYASIDFAGFKDVIDAIGGVDVDVPRSFTDPLFPRLGIKKVITNRMAQTITVTFEKGLQHMDGETALIYARSRHGNNGEGSDFARSKRQQQIILALKDKIMSSETLLSLTKIKKIMSAVSENLETNIGPWEGIQLAKSIKELSITPENIMINVITNGPTGPLYSDYYKEQYVLLPKKSDWSDIKNIARSPFDGLNKKFTGGYDNTAEINLIIFNGTRVGGLAGTVAITLEDFGYNIIEVDNAKEKNFEKNVIYNISDEDKTDALADIKNILNANVAQTIPQWLKEQINPKEKPDFVIITGEQI